MSELTADHFEPHLNKVFKVKDGRHELVLFKVERFGKTDQAVRQGLRGPFNALFYGPPGDLLPEGLHDLLTEDGQTFPLYVIPIQTFQPGRQDYQAVFT